jgi:hypothetical protein
MAARVAAAAATLLSAALTVGASPAYAAPTGGPAVEFSGGSVLSLLVCKSEPNAGRVSIPAETRVSFVNRLGQGATLRIDGKPVAQVGANQAVPVVFHYGPVNVAMTFSCGVGVVEEFKSVGVTVTRPAAQDGTRPIPAPGATVTPRTGTVPASTGRSPRGAAGGGTGEGVPTDEGGTEPVDPSLLGPDATASPVGAAAAPSTDNRVYVEAAVPASGTPRNGPAGLLALVAAVCVVGVGMAAIRAIIAQRSTRTGIA